GKEPSVFNGLAGNGASRWHGVNQRDRPPGRVGLRLLEMDRPHKNAHPTLKRPTQFRNTYVKRLTTAKYTDD
ncbi:hypothetical protein, partial [Pseudoscardovia radai]|uniref:hypothetical protein n=1 Tax=Pseudoscardovia radai TaxID=987066 RepID=UPI003994BC63